MYTFVLFPLALLRRTTLVRSAIRLCLYLLSSFSVLLSLFPSLFLDKITTPFPLVLLISVIFSSCCHPHLFPSIFSPPSLFHFFSLSLEDITTPCRVRLLPSPPSILWSNDCSMHTNEYNLFYIEMTSIRNRFNWMTVNGGWHQCLKYRGARACSASLLRCV